MRYSCLILVPSPPVLSIHFLRLASSLADFRHPSIKPIGWIHMAFVFPETLKLGGVDLSAIITSLLMTGPLLPSF